ncbi:MAG TPA: M14 metallopeptidase family protein [Opitutaceae bacterium]|nr:M14 metallopeptidase family protein [Opitutaceae bacterium]
MRLPVSVLSFATLALGFCAPVVAGVTAPREHFGFAIGDDYQLANFTQTEAYFKKVAAESDRVKLVDIGRTEEGRTQWMLVISAPENLRDLARYQSIAQKLARAEDLTDEQARALAAEGKAVVWIDGGLHADETLAMQQLIETVWQLASANDSEMQRVLRDVIVLCVHANPDGQELVSNWYMRERDAAQRVLTPTPRLYQKYVGHDNNRDFYLSSQKETTNLNRQLYLEWFPQIVYNHHQPAPSGTIMFVPPFRDPFNYVYDPLVVAGIERLGTAIQTRLLEEGMAGATTRSGASYSTWFNGGLRTSAYFHNMIGLLTEVAGNPTPQRIPFVPQRQLPTGDSPLPVAPQLWHARQSIAYEVAANRAVLDYAARHREALLYDIYRMGRNSIERGSRDTWTPRPAHLDEVLRLAAREGASSEEEPAETASAGGGATLRLPARFWNQLQRPEWRDPRGYIVPADQPDFPTAVKFINALVKTGVAIHRATADFSVGGKRYPAGSFVVKTNQAFRPQVLDMFEPQDHPNDFKYEGGPPTPPYDVAGYTLAFQMGVKFDRVLDAFDGPFERLPYGELQHPPPGRLDGAGAGLLVSHRTNDSFVLVNRLLKSGADVYWSSEGVPGDRDFGAGAIYVPDRPAARALIERARVELGLSVRALAAPPTGELLKLAPVRIAVPDRFGGSIDAGWTRWLLEQFEFPFEVIYAPQIDAGHLRERFDAIVFAGGAIPMPGERALMVAPPRDLPAEYESQIGRITAENSVPALREFLAAGGSVITLGNSCALAYQLALPFHNALVERSGGRERPLGSEKFFVPGSILEARVDPADPVAWGMDERADFYFNLSPAFRLPADAATRGLKAVAWFDNDAPLRSGWAWGQRYLKDSVTVATATVGSGKLYLMGSEVAFRGQTHGTFKLLFNALQLSTARPVTP